MIPTLLGEWNEFTQGLPVQPFVAYRWCGRSFCSLSSFHYRHYHGEICLRVASRNPSARICNTHSASRHFSAAMMEGRSPLIRFPSFHSGRWSIASQPNSNNNSRRSRIQGRCPHAGVAPLHPALIPMNMAIPSKQAKTATSKWGRRFP